MKKKYFEGWYMKHSHNGHMFAVIPGISRDESGRREAFIQVIAEDKSYYIAFDQREFYSDPDEFYVKIGCNEFSMRGVKLYIHHPELTLKGTIRYNMVRPLAYDIMGPFRFLPAMECRHGVLSMSHILYGDMTYNGNHMEFTGGTGYIEKDQGCSFPESYFWSQCSIRSEESVDLMIAAGKIPYMGTRFMGCISAVHFRGKEYRLASYKGARILRMNGQKIVIAQRELRLEAELLRSSEKLLYAPDNGGMKRKVYEDLKCRVRYKLYEKGRLLFRVTSDEASFECSFSRDYQDRDS